MEPMKFSSYHRSKSTMKKEKMMRNVKMLAAAAAVVAMTCGSAMAYPTGQINIPSTDAKGLKEVAIGINNYARFSTDGAAGANVFDLGITTGLLPFEKVKLEVGADYGTTGTATKQPMTYNAKLATTEDALFTGMPAIAIGGFNLGNAVAGGFTNAQNIGYALVARTFPVVGRISLGGYTGDKEVLTDANGKKDNTGVLASWDRSITEVSDKLWLGIDFASGKSALGGLGVGGSWAFSKQVSLLGGVTFYNEQTNNKPSFTTQVVISLP
jgi:hypothetical protein